jgi:Mrp family chromosome partitioning ATPase
MTALDRALNKAFQQRELHAPASLAADAKLAANGTTAGISASPARPSPECWSWPALSDRLLLKAEAGFRELAGQLCTAAAERQLKAIAFISPGRREGRTSVVMTLARILGDNPTTRVLVLEADFEHPDFNASLGLAPGAGLWEIVSGHAALEEPLSRLTGGGISWFPLTSPVSAVDLRRRAPHLQFLVRSLRERFDLILIDAGPVTLNSSGSPGPLWFQGCVDAVITVSNVRQRDSWSEWEAELGRWRRAGIESLGVVETFA